MSRRTWMVPAGVIVVGILSGCATAPAKQASVPSQQEQMQAVLAQISESTVMAVNAQRELALTSDAKAQQTIAARQRILTDRVSYDFYGDVETFMRDVAVKYGYSFVTFGKRPPEGVNTNVFVKNKPVVDVLRQVGVTLNPVLDVVVTKDTFELHYKKN